MAEVIENVRCLPPDDACRAGVSGGMVRVAEVAEDVSLAEPVPDRPDQFGGSAVARDGVVVLAEPVVHEADAVPGGAQVAGVVELLLQVEGGAAGSQRLFVSAAMGVGPADEVEHSC